MSHKKELKRNSNYCAAIICSLAAAILLLSSTVTQADDRYWNASYGDWSTADNWGGIEPSDFDAAHIENGGTATVTQNGEKCLWLYIGVANSGTIEMSNGSLTVTNYTYVGFTGTGTFSQMGGIYTITNYLYIGTYSGSKGTYNLNDTGQLSAGSEFIGSSGTGTFTQTSGTNSIYSNFFVGSNSGASGEYKLSGTGQLSADSEFIGSGGTGTFTQTGGINSISTNLRFGSLSGSKGTYNLNGGTLILKSLNKGSGSATFNFGGGTLQASGDFTTTLPMTLTGTGGNANFETASYAVTLSGFLSGTGGLNKLGSGTLTLSNTATYGGGTTVSGGTLIFAGGISFGGTSLIDVESGTVVLKTVNVSKNNLDIFTAASATFEAADHMHIVGNITGSGTTKVDSGASLTVASIQQNSLLIGSGAKVTIQAIPDGPLSGTITAVPEPSTLILFGAAFLMLMFRKLCLRITK